MQKLFQPFWISAFQDFSLMRGAGYWLGNRFAVAAAAPAPDRFGGEDDERNPDEGESDQVRAGERLVIKKNAEKKTAARRQVLKKTERGQAKMAGGVAEPNEGQTGYDAGTD